MSERRLHIIVSGVVQGVGYRAWSAREAQTLGLTGWVRNLPNGSVEILCEGGRDALDLFTVRLRVGPPSARVSDLVISEEPPQGNLAPFSIER